MARIKKLPKFVKLVKPEKPVKNKFDVKGFAEVAAKAAALPRELGSFIESVEDGEGITSFFWNSTQPGYVGWRWSVTVAQIDPSAEPTLCEVVLISGEDSLAAPKWVPWSERLADYQALQAELEKQAALEAEEDVEPVSEDELPVADSEESENTEQ